MSVPSESGGDRDDDRLVKEISLKKWIKFIERKPVVLTFNQQLDKLLNGGVTLGHMTEIFGEKGAGKTSLCLQVCLAARLPKRIHGLEAEAIFIDTEETLKTKRLDEMADACAQHCRHIPGFRSNVTKEYLLSGIHCVPCRKLQELEMLVLDLDDYIGRHPKIKMIIVDSLAFLFHVDVGPISSSAWMERNRFLYRFAQEMTHLINKYALAAVVTNNMTTRFGGNDGDKKYTIPCLGPSWLYLPQVRLELQKDGNRRKAVLHKSLQPIPDDNTVFVTVSRAGIR